MVEITIGLPVYNGAKYLDKALGSLCAQTFEDLQILVSDNASTDETPDIIAKWAAQDKRIVCHRQTENIGAAANYKWVLNNAESRWYCFSAHDDLCSPGFVESLHRTITAKSEPLLVVPRTIVLREDGSQNREFLFPEKAASVASRTARIRMALKRAHDGWYYGLYDRAALLSSFEQTRSWRHVWGQDYIVILPFILADRTTGSNEAVYYKRQTQLSDEHYKPKTGRDQCLLYREALRETFKSFNAAPLTVIEKIALAPALVRYVRKIQKPKRAVLAVAREVLS